MRWSIFHEVTVQPCPADPPRPGDRRDDRQSAVSAQRGVTTGAQNAPLTATVPVDPRITVGTLPNGLRYYIRAQQAAAEPRRAPARRQRRLGARGRRSARARALRRAHGLQRHAPLPEAGRRRVPAVDRHALRRARQRQHQLRPDGLPAADSDRQRRRHRPVAPDPRGLGARRLVRSGRDRQGARRRPGGVADGPRRRRAHAGQAAARSCSRTRATPSACRSASRRSSGRFPLRAPEEVLHRLVSARPDGGDRRRRLRPGRDRSADQVALRRDSGGRVAAAAADLRRARSARHALHHRHRPRGDRDDGQRRRA